jgi:SAM-dependent methyltransferase
MRLNLGCGNRKLAGWHNVDKVAACNPDQVVDLEALPWPWPTDSVDEAVLSHVLEHLGAATGVYLGIFQELYRVCRNGGRVTIVVPHPRHDNFLNDPTHVRLVTETGLLMFSQAANRRWIAAGGADTPLGIYLGIDFETLSVQRSLAEPWGGRFERGEISDPIFNMRHGPTTTSSCKPRLY